jgi:hypothetical protein
MASCFTHLVTTNGPVPTGASQFSSWLRSSAVGDWMATHGWESDSRRALSGWVRVNRTTFGSTASVD